MPTEIKKLEGESIVVEIITTEQIINGIKTNVEHPTAYTEAQIDANLVNANKVVARWQAMKDLLI